MHKISVNNKIILAPEGAILSDILMKSGAKTEHPCGGKGTCKKCLVLVNGKEELTCQYKVKSDIDVVIPENNEIHSETGAKSDGKMTENCCLCLDIGTTTLALALVSLDEKKIVKVTTATNPQRAFGGDVLTRIEWCIKNGINELHSTLINEINKMVLSMDAGAIKTMYVAGNTTMLHLFFNIDPSSIGVAPYTPIFLESKSEKGYILGLNVISLPCISSFVGADLVAGVNYADMPSENKYNLLVDLGTNAEIVLYNNKTLFCTSAAAGPCFEGANITCGMSATDGAIYAYSEYGNLQTINNKAPKGICGTGLVDIIAELVENGTIDETGYMETEEFSIIDSVKLTQGDVRRFQLAKSAVYSGIQALLREKEISISDIENLFISGGFSAKINIDNAVKLGLLPKELKDKCVPLNNSSLLGTVKFACEKNDLSVYTKNAEYIDLSTNQFFSELFIENMEF